MSFIKCLILVDASKYQQILLGVVVFALHTLYNTRRLALVAGVYCLAGQI